MKSGDRLAQPAGEPAVELYSSGQSISAIARATGLSKSAVGRAITKSGVQKRSRSEVNRLRCVTHPPKRKVNRVDAARLYQSGMTLKEVALELGVAMVTIQKALAAEGVKTRPRGSNRSGGFNKHITKYGYVTIRTGVGKRDFEHIMVAESVLGRRLKSNEVVHHINGDRSDNRKCNLLICDKGYHSALHWKMTQIQRKEMNNESAKPTVGLDNTTEYQRRLDGQPIL